MRRPITHVPGSEAAGLPDALDRSVLPLAVLFIALLARKIVQATPGARRVVLPLAVAAGFVAVQFVIQFAILGGPVNSYSSRHPVWFWIVTAAGLAVPVALASGLLWGRHARAGVADFVVELERTPPGAIRDALARTLGDPTLELALWLPERRSYVDASGRVFELPAPGSDRAVTVLGPPDDPVAALVHDPALLERRALLTSAGAAARLALENERLQAELRAQLAELRASRARIVRPGTRSGGGSSATSTTARSSGCSRLGLALQLARAKLDAGRGRRRRAPRRGRRRAARGARRAARARPRHPPGGAHRAGPRPPRSTRSPARSPVPVDARRGSRRAACPAPVEAAAYFVVSRGARERRQVRARLDASGSASPCVDGRVVVDVADDGDGRRRPRARLRAARARRPRRTRSTGGSSVVSPPGSGTRLTAEIPCA